MRWPNLAGCWFCTLGGHYSSKLAQQDMETTGPEGDRGPRISFPIFPPHPETASPVTPCSCHLHVGVPLLATSGHKMVEYQSSESPHLRAAAQVEMTMLDLGVTGADRNQIWQPPTPLPAGPLPIGLVHPCPEKVFFR